MQFHFNFISFIDSLALFQGVLLGVLLILGNRKKRPSLFLGLFLITYTIELVNSILSDTGVLEQYPNLRFLPINFYFLSIPFLYLYTKSLMMSVSIRKNWPIFIPGILEFIVFTGLFLLPVATKLSIYQNETFELLMNLYLYLAIIYSVYFALLTIKLLKKHQNNLLNYYSNVEKWQLKWVRKIAIFIIAFYSFWLVVLLVFDELMNNNLYLFFSAINVIFIYWVAISGFKQAKVELITEVREHSDNKKTHNSTVFVENEQDKIYQCLNALMEEQKQFTESELTLPILAKELSISRNQLSQVINQKSGVHFNLFINQYRVKEAKRLLHDSDFDHFNMLGIAYEVGFSSKATFFAVFKQIAGLSPGAFKKTKSQT